jgi:acyl transferase domain-containing protein
MDPQQRILLHTAYEALEDAGYTGEDPEEVGVFVGCATGDWEGRINRLGEGGEKDTYYSTGNDLVLLTY